MLRRIASMFAVSMICLPVCHAAAKRLSVEPDQGWLTHNATSDETNYSPLQAINSTNVGHLGLSWSIDLRDEVSLEATPLEVNGVLYFTGSYGTVYAVNGKTGKQLWRFDPETWKYAPTKMHFALNVNRGVAFDGGRIFSAALDGRLFALDASTGKQIWVTDTIDPKSMQTVTGAPRTFNGKVVIGNGGADFGARGYVSAYDQETGRQVWRFYLAPGAPEENKGDPAMEQAADTWRGDYWKTGTGGGPWDSITFDSELNRLYIGTGNASPSDPEVRSPGGGDNLYTASIVALEADSGRYVWHYQVNPRDSWDYDATQQMTLADLVIDGTARQVLMQAPKNGFFYVLDRHSGKLISAEKYSKATWAERIDLTTGRPVEAKNIHYETGELTIWPGPTGAHSWQSISFSPDTHLVYIPYMQTGEHYSRRAPQKGELSIGGLSSGTVSADSRDGKGGLLAWDPARQKEIWRSPYETLWNGGALATAGGLVFQGSGNGYIYAYDATTGRELWKYNAAMGINASPITWSADGTQYVSILAGYGGTAAIVSDIMNAGWKFSGPRRLLTFALGGNATSPTSPSRDATVHAVDDRKLGINSADVSAGRALFLACAICHGRDLVSAGGPAPDLRESTIALVPDTFFLVVHDGVLIEKGMPRFDNLTREQVMQIWAYIRQGARDALK